MHEVTEFNSQRATLFLIMCPKCRRQIYSSWGSLAISADDGYSCHSNFRYALDADDGYNGHNK